MLKRWGASVKNSGKKANLFLLDDSATSRSVLTRLAQTANLDFRISYFSRQEDLLSHIKKLKREDLPTSFILDCIGQEGCRTADEIIEHYRNISAPLPLFCFTSASVDLSFAACENLLGRDPGLRVNFSEVQPLGQENDDFIAALVKGDRQVQYPCCNGLREVLNRELGLTLPLTVDDSFYARQYRDLALAEDATPSTLPQLLQLLYSANSRETLSFHSLCEISAKTLRLLTGDPTANENLPPSLFVKNDIKIDFHLAVGKAAWGPVAFSPKDVEKNTCSSILVLRDYPHGGSLAPLFNRLAGLVILSPDIADHVEYLLREKGLSGLIGHEGSSATESTSPFIEGDKVSLVSIQKVPDMGRKWRISENRSGTYKEVLEQRKRRKPTFAVHRWELYGWTLRRHHPPKGGMDHAARCGP
jgi:hypothetical protein